MFEKEELDILNKALSSPVMFHPIFATISGGAKQGMLLSYLHHLSSQSEAENNWLNLDSEKCAQDTGLTASEQEKARKKLIRLGLLEEDSSGKSIRLDTRKLYSLIQEKAKNL